MFFFRYVERAAARLGAEPPPLTLEQLDTPAARAVANAGRAAGVAGGRSSRRHVVAINCDRVGAEPRFFLEGGDEERFVLATKNSLARPPPRSTSSPSSSRPPVIPIPPPWSC